MGARLESDILMIYWVTCEINAAHYIRNEPTWLRLGYGDDLSFSILGSILIVST